MKNHGALVGAVVALVVAGGLALRPNEHQQMLAAITKLNATMPRQVDEMTTQTAVTLDDHVVRNLYTVNQQFETDAATVAALRQGLLKMACARPQMREMLARGYSVDNVYDVPTPHGPDKLDVLIKPGDCP